MNTSINANAVAAIVQECYPNIMDSEWDFKAGAIREDASSDGLLRFLLSELTPESEIGSTLGTLAEVVRLSEAVKRDVGDFHDHLSAYTMNVLLANFVEAFVQSGQPINAIHDDLILWKRQLPRELALAFGPAMPALLGLQLERVKDQPNQAELVLANLRARLMMSGSLPEGAPKDPLYAIDQPQPTEALCPSSRPPEGQPVS